MGSAYHVVPIYHGGSIYLMAHILHEAKTSILIHRRSYIYMQIIHERHHRRVAQPVQ